MEIKNQAFAEVRKSLLGAGFEHEEPIHIEAVRLAESNEDVDELALTLFLTFNMYCRYEKRRKAISMAKKMLKLPQEVREDYDFIVARNLATVCHSKAEALRYIEKSVPPALSLSYIIDILVQYSDLLLLKDLVQSSRTPTSKASWKRALTLYSSLPSPYLILHWRPEGSLTSSDVDEVETALMNIWGHFKAREVFYRETREEELRQLEALIKPSGVAET